MTHTAEDKEDPLAAFMAGRMPLDTAARALSRDGPRFVRIHDADDPSAPPEILAATAQFRVLMARVDEITADEALIERDVQAPRIETGAPPADPTHFCQSVEVVVSGRDRRRAYRTSMRLYICTPSWLDERVRENGPTWTPAPLIIRRWHAGHVQAAIAARVASTPANTWAEFVTQLSRVMEPEA